MRARKGRREKERRREKGRRKRERDFFCCFYFILFFLSKPQISLFVIKRVAETDINMVIVESTCLYVYERSNVISGLKRSVLKADGRWINFERVDGYRDNNSP